MSKEVALTLAVQMHAAGKEAHGSVLDTARAYLDFLGEPAQATTSTPSKRSKSKDAAPTEPLNETATVTETAKSEPDTAKPAKTEQKTTAAEPTATEDDIRDLIKKVAGNAAIGPVPVRAALGKCVNPDTGKAATTISTLHTSHYAQVATELRAVLEKATKDAKAA